jgi:nucleoside-diphosphate-sugar epimerase
MISIYGGSGFIGSMFIKNYKDNCCVISRNKNSPQSGDILYFISTVDNYNVFTDPYLDINTNLTKLIQVLEECRKTNEKVPVTFNFISSWFVYGKTNDLPAKETSNCNPTGFYSITKYAAEKLLISYCETFGMSYRILRLTNIIGVGLDNAPKNEIINISNSEPTAIGDIINYANLKLNSISEIESITPPDFHKVVQIKNMWLDNSKLVSYGYIPKTKTFETVDKIIKALL